MSFLGALPCGKPLARLWRLGGLVKKFFSRLNQKCLPVKLGVLALLLAVTAAIAQTPTAPRIAFASFRTVNFDIYLMSAGGETLSPL
ncbi:hypothetical protein [Kamptonema formosum]|uniref:hypothetical protein n=1 Tax=Kamptonema formosum TaxID=331992 RepID=UPI0003488D67|nr:hypothetical protein [Oscillatoria sp. PCC 10802]